MGFAHNFSKLAMTPNQITLLRNTAKAVAKMEAPLWNVVEYMKLYDACFNGFVECVANVDKDCIALLKQLDAGFESTDSLRMFQNITCYPRRINGLVH
jgi:hypothetical protein